jgi:hypothetical protein
LHRQKELVYAPGGLADALQALANLSPAQRAEMGEANYTEVRRYPWTGLAAVLGELVDPRATRRRAANRS